MQLPPRSPMTAQHSNIVVSPNRPDLSPHLTTVSRKEDSKAIDMTGLESCDGAPTLSFKALSLQHTVAPATTDGESPRARRSMSADLDVFAPQSPTGTCPAGLMVRTVSLEPKTVFGETTGSFREDKMRRKRGRHVSCDSLPCDEIVRQTQKRRRLANRNRALTSSDFDSILSDLGPLEACL